ncbi:MAG: hypothetical protein IH602_06120 [Bryobacteraceae bacterium]|nr:hypothetical protein [Bryobacteraceae bacterium]
MSALLPASDGGCGVASKQMLPRAILMLAFCAAFAAWAGDEDRDGLDDAFEQALLERFRPTFMLSATECDVMPSEFLAGTKDPVKPVRNGTIYGQVFPLGVGRTRIEIHYYHLWARDCGFGQHPFDVEHVAVLLEAEPEMTGEYKAKYWYSAAHEGTVCDAAHGARAADLAAETSGATVWVSHGKHASFLSNGTCNRLGCGGDRCQAVTAMPPGKLINVGEPGAPMNGAVWTSSRKWGLRAKMVSEFTPEVIARIESAEPREVIALHPALVPAKAFILGGNHTLTSIGTGGKHTGSALQTADKHTSNALGVSARKTGGALKTAFRSTGRFLGIGRKKDPAQIAEKKQDPSSQ